MDLMEDARSLLSNIGPELVYNLMSSVLIIFFLWLLRFVIIRLISRKVQDTRTRYNWRKFSGYVTVTLGIFLIARVWLEEMATIGTFLGLLSAGIAIALKDPLVNFAGWIFIIWRRPFQVGDRIQIGGYAGDVIDQRIFQFTVLEIGNWVDADQHTGRMVHIPNGKVFNDVQANYSSGFQFIWNEIPVLITFESDWKEARRILEDIVMKHASSLSEIAQKEMIKVSGEYLIMEDQFTPVVYTSVEDCGVLLTLRYPVRFKTRRDSEQLVWEEILNAFEKYDNIDFAYPTQRFYNNTNEGKIGTRPKE